MGLFGHGKIQKLIDASKNGDNNQIIKLIQKGIDVNAKDSDGLTPLFYAAQEGQTETVKLLIDNGADVHAKDNVGLTPLHYATRMCHNETVKLLLKNVLDMDTIAKVMASGGKTNCDLCNGPIETKFKIVKSLDFKQAVRNGLRPGYLRDVGRHLGIADDKWDSGWVDNVSRGQDDWALCDSCFSTYRNVFG